MIFLLLARCLIFIYLFFYYFIVFIKIKMSVNSTTLKSSAIINPEETKNNPMNNSTSKMLYSFPKDKRFPK